MLCIYRQSAIVYIGQTYFCCLRRLEYVIYNTNQMARGNGYTYDPAADEQEIVNKGKENFEQGKTMKRQENGCICTEKMALPF